MNALAACWAAARRFGATSVAAIDVETSVTSMTSPSQRETATDACGRASATASAASARHSSAAGRWRRQPGVLGATEASVSSAAKRTA